MAPALLGVVGCVLGAGVGFAVHRYVVEPSDDELRAVAATLTPAGFVADSEPVVSGAWAPSLDRGVLHWDAASPSAVTLGDVADGLRDGGWEVDSVAEADVKGYVRGARDGLVTTTFLAPTDSGDAATASISLGRGPHGAALAGTVLGGAVVGAAVGVSGTMGARRWRSTPAPSFGLDAESRRRRDSAGA